MHRELGEPVASVAELPCLLLASFGELGTIQVAPATSAKFGEQL